jgi:hypothetical protein
VHIDEISAQGWSLVEREIDLEKVKQLEAKISRKDTLQSYERCRHCEAVVRTGSNDAETHLREEYVIHIFWDDYITDTYCQTDTACSSQLIYRIMCMCYWMRR